MTKNEQTEMTRASYYVTMGRPDMAARAIATVHRSARSKATQAAALALIQKLNLTDRVTMVNGCLVTN